MLLAPLILILWTDDIRRDIRHDLWHSQVKILRIGGSEHVAISVQLL